jgi:hypothetical protein
MLLENQSPKLEVVATTDRLDCLLGLPRRVLAPHRCAPPRSKLHGSLWGHVSDDCKSAEDRAARNITNAKTGSEVKSCPIPAAAAVSATFSL